MKTNLRRRQFLRSSSALVALRLLQLFGFLRFASAAPVAAPPKRMVFLCFGLRIVSW
jgi:hypothetical protein